MTVCCLSSCPPSSIILPLPLALSLFLKVIQVTLAGPRPPPAERLPGLQKAKNSEIPRAGRLIFKASRTHICAKKCNTQGSFALEVSTASNGIPSVNRASARGSESSIGCQRMARKRSRRPFKSNTRDHIQELQQPSPYTTTCYRDDLAKL